MRARLPDRLLVQGQGRVSIVQRPAHGGDRGASRRSRLAAAAGAPVGWRCPSACATSCSATPISRVRRCACSCGGWSNTCGRTVRVPAPRHASARWPSSTVSAPSLNAHLHFHCVVVIDGVFEARLPFALDRRRELDPAHPGLRVRPAPQRVATTVTVAAHPCATPGRRRACPRQPARTRPPWRRRPPESAATSVRSSPLPPKMDA